MSDRPKTAVLHYTAPPVIGGVEAVVLAHVEVFLDAGYPVTVVAGRGSGAVLPSGAGFETVPEVDSRHPEVAEMAPLLEAGEMPPHFESLVDRLVKALGPILGEFDNVIVHNVFTKHFNLPLTAALCRLLDAGTVRNCIAWCHDFTWTSPSSRSKVHPGYPWDVLRVYRPDVAYVVVSERRRRELAALFGCSGEEVRVVYNGVNPRVLLGLSGEGHALVRRLGLIESDIALLMPVRVTRAKNIEYAIRVAAALKALGCRPKLVVTGPPDPHDADSMAYFESLQSLRDGLGVSDEVRFVFESGPEPGGHHTIDEHVVGELFRVCDVMFMPSHREGFAMPVLEAGLVGMPVVCTDVPAAEEIGGEDVTVFEAGADPAQVAGDILLWQAEQNPVQRMRRRVRREYTWEAIFRRDIEPMLWGRGEAGP